jgi:nucleoid-associated protein YgaU
MKVSTSMEAYSVRSRVLHKGVAPVVVGAAVSLVVPAQALAKAEVRFVHAVPGVGKAGLALDGHKVGAIGFGQATGFLAVHSGPLNWALSGAGKTLAKGTTTLGDGAYDIVVLQHGAGVRLGVYQARGGKPGTALVRVIHAAPEFGMPQLTVDGKVAVKSLAYTKATPYVPLPAGTHKLGAERPGSSTPLLSAALTVQNGKSYSAVVVGTRGQKVRVLGLVDRGAPSAAQARPVSDQSGSASGSTVVVKAGDSLWSIAEQQVGAQAGNAAIESKVQSIYAANASRIGTGDPNLIFPGTRLSV